MTIAKDPISPMQVLAEMPYFLVAVAKDPGYEPPILLVLDRQRNTCWSWIEAAKDRFLHPAGWSKSFAYTLRGALRVACHRAWPTPSQHEKMLIREIETSALLDQILVNVQTLPDNHPWKTLTGRKD